MNKALKVVMMIIGGIIIGVGLAFLLGFVVMWLWNWLMPDIFGLPEIGYWQAWGLLVLSHLLLGGGHKIHHKHDHREKRGSFRDHLHGKIKEHEHLWGGCGDGGSDGVKVDLT